MTSSESAQSRKAPYGSASPAATLIIVDDDDDIREALSTLFSLEGYEVRTAENGVEGLCLISDAAESGACIVLLDMMMPEMSGAEVMHVLRDADQLPKLPVVVISATTPVPAEVAGARLCMHKPLDTERLLAVMRRLSASLAA